MGGYTSPKVHTVPGGQQPMKKTKVGGAGHKEVKATKKLKAHEINLKQAAPDEEFVGKRVIVEGLASKPELNGSKGIATAFDDAKGRYNVWLDSGAQMALKPANVLPEEPASTSDVPKFGQRLASNGAACLKPTHALRAAC